jgi:hypothetical protein
MRGGGERAFVIDGNLYKCKYEEGLAFVDIRTEPIVLEIIDEMGPVNEQSEIKSSFKDLSGKGNWSTEKQVTAAGFQIDIKIFIVTDPVRVEYLRRKLL